MGLTSTAEMLRDATDHGYAVAAFNVENLEMAQAVVTAAARLGSSVIVQTTPSTLKYASLGLYRDLVATLADARGVRAAMHLDHGDSFELAVKALRAGYTSVMYDGSGLPFEENLAITAAVVRACGPNDVPVEAELGKVGGKEDGLVVDEGTYTDPDAAADFVARSGASSLAVAIGTQHGVYKGTPVLDVALLRRIRSVVDVPLVLHGSSGLSAGAVRECIEAGIAKVNFATELRIAYTRATTDYLAGHPDAVDPKAYGARARDAVMAVAEERIALCSSTSAT